MPRRSRRWIWAGRAAALLVVVALAVYLLVAGLEKADKVASVVAAAVAVLALAAPYVLPAEERSGQSISDTTVRGNVRQEGENSQRIDGLRAGGDLTQTQRRRKQR
ncbi:MAG: hypothetical protein JWO79_5079 [Actinomycetia bacterium]|jgi:hypothetical protein|nr:hypothetical protein [Actinomycetes bacterium]MDQ1651628.1 hypothetical protein [Cryptosporangiaceae bacterium]